MYTRKMYINILLNSKQQQVSSKGGGQSPRLGATPEVHKGTTELLG